MIVSSLLSAFWLLIKMANPGSNEFHLKNSGYRALKRKMIGSWKSPLKVNSSMEDWAISVHFKDLTHDEDANDKQQQKYLVSTLCQAPCNVFCR